MSWRRDDQERLIFQLHGSSEARRCERSRRRHASLYRMRQGISPDEDEQTLSSDRETHSPTCPCFPIRHQTTQRSILYATRFVIATLSYNALAAVLSGAVNQ
jgi:hypothetical protein